MRNGRGVNRNFPARLQPEAPDPHTATTDSQGEASDMNLRCRIAAADYILPLQFTLRERGRRKVQL